MINIHNPSIEVHLAGSEPPNTGAAVIVAPGGGLSARGGIPFGTWTARFVEWFKDLGFLEQPGTLTKAAADIEAYARKSPR